MLSRPTSASRVQWSVLSIAQWYTEMKLHHAIIQEVEWHAREWNASEYNEPPPPDGRPDYKWLADYSMTNRPLSFRVNDQQRLYLEGLTSSLPMEDIKSIIDLFRLAVADETGSQKSSGMDRLVALMAQVIAQYIDQSQRLKLLRDKGSRCRPSISSRLFFRRPSNRIGSSSHHVPATISSTTTSATTVFHFCPSSSAPL